MNGFAECLHQLRFVIVLAVDEDIAAALNRIVAPKNDLLAATALSVNFGW